MDGSVLFETTSAVARVKALESTVDVASDVSAFAGVIADGFFELLCDLRGAFCDAEQMCHTLKQIAGDETLNTENMLVHVFGFDQDVMECRAMFELTNSLWKSLEHMDGKVIRFFANKPGFQEFIDFALSQTSVDQSLFPGGWLHHAGRLLLQLGELTRNERRLVREEAGAKGALTLKRMNRHIPDEEVVRRFTNMDELVDKIHEMFECVGSSCQELAPMFLRVQESLHDVQERYNYLRRSLPHATLLSSLSAEANALRRARGYLIDLSVSPVVVDWSLDPAQLLPRLHDACALAVRDCERLRQSIISATPPLVDETERPTTLAGTLGMYARETEVTLENIESLADSQLEVSRLTGLSYHKAAFLDSLACATSLAFLNQRINYLREANQTLADELHRYLAELATVRSNTAISREVLSLQRTPRTGCPCFPRQYALATCGHTFCSACYASIMSHDTLACPHCQAPFTCADIIVINYSTAEEHSAT